MADHGYQRLLELSDEDSEALRGVLEQEPVVAASLFGSRAIGSAGAHSDLDVAVWLDPALDAGQRLRVRLGLARRLADAGLSARVDLLVLNDAPPLVGHRALRDKRALVDRDPRTRVRLETDALIRFLDTVELRAALSTGQRARLAEGRFGRP